MRAVEGKKWNIGSKHQYYAFLTWLINQLVATGKDTKEAIEAVVLDSGKLGRYWIPECHYPDETGSRRVCGVYDLANTTKMLACSNKEDSGFWLAGGCYYCNSNVWPLAHLERCEDVDCYYGCSVGWLVLA